MRRNGLMSFTLHAAPAGSVFLRLAQYQRYLDETYRLDFAKALIRSKISAQIQWVMAQRWEVDEGGWRDSVEQMKRLEESIASRSTLDELRGTEGSASR